MTPGGARGRKRKPPSRTAVWCLGVGIFLWALAAPPAAAASGGGPVLITEGEAMLQDAPTRKGPGEERSEGPRIVIMSPEDGKAYLGPVDIDMRFESAPGAAGVRSDTLRVVYVKLWDIDITDRFRPYLQANRLHVAQARLPAGRHQIRVSIADAAGHTSTRLLRVIVQGDGQ